MENALQFELSGAADQGSGTSLATASANLDGTTAVLSALDSVLRPRYPGLAGVTAWVDRTRALLDAHSRTPVAALSGVDRERLDGAVGQLLEVLAPIAAIAEVRRGS
jgi:iron uptake system component EfeO